MNGTGNPKIRQIARQKPESPWASALETTATCIPQKRMKESALFRYKHKR
jgi:hypothetical protein